MRITSNTRIFALLGNPVSHSISPVMQNLAFRVAGLDAVYVAIRCTEADLLGVVRSLTSAGGGGNVTVPHKRAAALAGKQDKLVAQIGVANVFGSDNGQPIVGNTDVDGLLALLDQIGAPASCWCLLGTGGSARAAVAAAATRGVRLCVKSRSETRAEEFAAWASTLGVKAAIPEECEVAINATPVGLKAEDPAPVDLTLLPSLKVVADLTYRREGTTELVRQARACGLRAADGKEMLLIQGAAAWHFWFPGVEVPKEAMRAAITGGVD